MAGASRSGIAALRAVPALVLAVGLAAAAAAPASAWNVYYGNFHAHSALSDGIGTPAEAYAYARDVADIDILSLTEHTHMMDASAWAAAGAAAEAATEPGVFVALRAQEFGYLSEFGHINIFDCPYLNPNPPSNLPATYNFLQSVGALGSFSHPNPEYGSHFENLYFYPQYADAMKALEIRNGLELDGYEPQYIQVLTNGWKVGPFGNQDNHNGRWGDQPTSAGDIYLTGVLADTLTAPAILEALHARRFYAMEVSPPSDRIELDFAVDEHPMGSVVTTSGQPRFTVWAHGTNGVSLFNRVELLRDGVVRDSRILIGNTISYDFTDGLADGESHFYYARVSQVDGDQCWSAPVWVTAEVGSGAVADLPGELRLLAPAPNPFERTTRIRFHLPPAGPNGGEGLRSAAILVHDAAGRTVRQFGPRLSAPGEHAWEWDGRDAQGRALPAGIWYYLVTVDGRQALRGSVALIR